MNILKKVQSVLFIFIFSSLFFGCSYKPASHYAKQEIQGNVYVKVSLDLEDPQNSVMVKDSIYKMLVQKLDVDIVEKESLADIIMNVNINRVGLQTLQYDEFGNNKLYRAVASINFSYYEKGQTKRKSFSVEGEYDFSIKDVTVSSDERFEGIRKASDNSLEEVLSKIAVSAYKK
jgi:hypothetical protein